MSQPEESWTIDTLRQHVLEIIAGQNRIFAEMDRRYQDRFEAQAEAITAALAAANRTMDEVGTTTSIREQVASIGSSIAALDKLTDAKFVTFRTLIDAQAVQVALALTSSDKAVTKAEIANDKRFEGVNEFRAQQADIIATFIPRVEAEQRMTGNSEKIDHLELQLNALTARMDRGEGRSGGHTDSTKNLVTIVGIVLTAITVLVGLYLAFHR